MGYLFDHYCHETIEQAQACVFGHPDPLIIGDDIFFPSYENAIWIYKTAGTPPRVLATPQVTFPYCDPVGPVHVGEEISLASDFWIPLFWAIGLSASFMLFKKA